jgi:FkbM family methyltransferase
VLASELVGISGRVIAVEPQTRLQPVIQQNLMLNRCANVEVRRCVVADKVGSMNLKIAHRTNTGASSLFTKSGKTETVPALSLVDLFVQAGIESCKLIKIDAEGAEYDIITSSTELLKSGRIAGFSIDLHDSILAERKLSVGPIHFTLAKCGYSLLRGSHPALYVLDAN